jgi:FMNH2-dependent dimethyl sulfone monooxygenase
MPTYPALPQSKLPQAEWFKNSDKEIQFAYWVPNISGGLVVTTLPMQTGWDHEANVRYAQIAEQNGFSTALAQTRWFASYGADHQHEAFVISAHILAKTKRLTLLQRAIRVCGILASWPKSRLPWMWSARDVLASIL